MTQTQTAHTDLAPAQLHQDAVTHQELPMVIMVFYARKTVKSSTHIEFSLQMNDAYSECLVRLQTYRDGEP